MSIRNEQIKLRATYLNQIAVTVLAVGGLMPMIALLMQGIGDVGNALLTGILCFFTSPVLHLLAQASLAELDDSK